jgi:cytochrome c biogenesis protein
VRKVDLRAALDARMGAANKTNSTKHLRNVGPSASYKLRDAAGQAIEFNNYLLPVDTGDGSAVFLLGVRTAPAEPFRYLRIPADEQGTMDEFFRLRHALLDPRMRELAVKRYASQAVDPQRPELAQQLGTSAQRALALFAGASADTAALAGQRTAGLQAVADFIEKNVPESERERAGGVFVRILNGAVFELAQLAREKAGLKPMSTDEKTRAFMTQAVFALSDVALYPAPVALQLTDFTQVQASVFQVARAPGKTVVYLGCALLILGIFAMLYVRERRLWIWLEPLGATEHAAVAGAQATMALSTNRKTMDGDREFEQLKAKLLGLPENPIGGPTP